MGAAPLGVCGVVGVIPWGTPGSGQPQQQLPARSRPSAGSLQLPPWLLRLLDEAGKRPELMNWSHAAPGVWGAQFKVSPAPGLSLLAPWVCTK